MATQTERLAIVVDADASKGIAQFKQLGGEAKKLGGPIGQAGGLLQKFSGQLGGLAGASAGPAALLAVGAGIVKFALNGVSAFVDLAGRVKEFRRVAGGTAEEASKLVAAFSAVGVDATTAATGVFQLEKHLASGADKLAGFGVVAVKDAKGNTDMSKTLLSVSDAYHRIEDPVQRAALLTAAFGRQGTALIPLLSKSREEIKGFFDEAAKSHQILSDEDLKKATEYKLAMHDLGEAFKGLEMEAGKALLPFLASVAKGATEVIHLTDTVSGFIAKLAQVPAAAGVGVKPTTILDALGQAIPGAGTLIDLLGHMGIKSDEAAAKVGHLGGALSGVADILGGFKTADDAAAAGLDGLDKALSTAGDADRALASAHHATGDAQAALNKLLGDGAVDATKVADATRSLADATRAVGHEQRAQADAQHAYNLALAAFNTLGTDTARNKLHDATNNLADANDNVASSLDRQNAAAAALATAKAGDPDYQQKLADAKNKVADATLNESQRALASVTAHEAETKALSDNADQVQTLYDKYTAMIKQHPEVAAALAGNLAALAPAVANQNSLAGATPTFKAGDPAAILGTLNGTAPPVPVQYGPPVSPAPLPTQPARGPVTINNTINTPVDLAALGRNLVWNLN